LVTFPVKWDSVEFNTVNGLEVNIESAITQLDRYKMVQNTWCHQNVSNTISYSPEEVPDIIDWLLANWDTYIGVSFLYRSDPTKTAKDLGYQYLPQETVTKEKYEEYVKRLKLVDVYSVSGFDEIEQDACATGACPIK
jgi:ribonucleoside-triphosphate reductase